MYLASSIFLFFFSSRRRHTRYWRDWSSDVCSSDLERGLQAALDERHDVEHRLARLARHVVLREGAVLTAAPDAHLQHRIHARDYTGSRAARRSCARGQACGFTNRGGRSPATMRTIWSAPSTAMLRRASCVTPAVWKLAITLGMAKSG